jgi:hypothetical protein
LAGFQAAEVGVSFGFPGQVAPLFWLSVMVFGDGCRRGFGMCLFVGGGGAPSEAFGVHLEDGRATE